MNKIKKTKILNLNIKPNHRLLFMSDIHGDVNLFSEILKDMNFSDNDYLFVIGDMIEKGDFTQNKKMLDYIIELNEKNNVYFMSGNCDEVLRFIQPPVDKDMFLYYALKRGSSIINDLAYELNVDIDENIDVDAFCNKLIDIYPKYYKFIEGLPDVIFINDKLVLVHGGIKDINNIPTNAIDVLKYDNFYKLSPVQPKYMIVGHFPTRNYREMDFNVNPIIDNEKKIICIDGGNHVVKGGQINVLYLNDIDKLDFEYKAYDHYPKYVIEEDINHASNDNQINIVFGQNEVKILDDDLDYYYIKHIKSGINMWVHSSFVYNIKDNNYCYDGSNSFLSLKKGDLISVIKTGMPFCVVKHNGVIGLIESKYINESKIYNS